MKKYDNNGIIHTINGKNAKNFVLRHKNEFTKVPFDFIYKGMLIDEKTRQNKGTTKVVIDVHGTIYFIGLSVVFELKEVNS